MPVWLTLLTLVGGVFATYWLAPLVNQRFEQEKIRFQYISDNLKTFNQKTGEMVILIGDLNRSLKRGTGTTESVQKIEALATELQWRTFEYDVIFGTKDAKSKLDLYQDNLEELRKVVVDADSISDTPSILCRSFNFVSSSHELLRMLASQARITVSADRLVQIPRPQNCATGNLPSKASPSLP
ncbi:MAG TPA: hypothetical protein VED40_06930 [Azospirillaceae bacterium]|nr:hypothetical protein [Azospirillaceae bacterium]